MNRHACTVDLPRGGRLTLQIDFFLKNRDIRPEKEKLDERPETAGSPFNRRGKYIAAIFAGMDNAGS
jgi:hypothetical protein